jgi:thiol-disulfide isomerase/thioredoxin
LIMLYKFFLFLTLTLLVSTVLSAQIEFRTEDYEAAVADAKAQNKMLFIDFRADWCKPCREMEQTTFQDPTLSEYVHSKYIPVKADVDYSFFAMDLKEKYNVSSLPTILILDPNTGEVYLRIIGKKPASILLEDLKSIEKYVDSSEEPEQTHEEIEPEKKKKPCRIFKRKSTSYLMVENASSEAEHLKYS